MEKEFDSNFRSYERGGSKHIGGDDPHSENLKEPVGDTAKTPDFERFSGAPGVGQRAKSSLRLKYEAEVSLVKRKLGSLEDMRGKLGLTQRKICQLLLVDPSAWTRWTKTEDEAPPHIYRMLQWYLALEEKYPSLDVNFWLASVSRIDAAAGNADRDEKLKQLTARQFELDLEINRLRLELEYERSRTNERNQLESTRPAETTRIPRWPAPSVVWVILFAIGILLGMILARR